jgi:hypothetical protein
MEHIGSSVLMVAHNEAGVCEVDRKGSFGEAAFSYTREQRRLTPHLANTM